MKLFDDITTWLRERDLRQRLRAPIHPAAAAMLTAELQTAPAIGSPLEPFGERLGEQLRLAKKIADDSARCDIESYCTFQRMGRYTWYDTHSLSQEGVFVGQDISLQVRYLDLRRRLVRHPTQKHLVRFEK